MPCILSFNIIHIILNDCVTQISLIVPNRERFLYQKEIEGSKVCSVKQLCTQNNEFSWRSGVVWGLLPINTSSSITALKSDSNRKTPFSSFSRLAARHALLSQPFFQFLFYIISYNQTTRVMFIWFQRYLNWLFFFVWLTYQNND